MSGADSATDAGLQVDFVLAQRPDTSGQPEWILYRIVPLPDGSAGSDWRGRLCLQVLRCNRTTDRFSRGSCRIFRCR